MHEDRITHYENVIFPGSNLWIPEKNLDLYISVMSILKSDGHFAHEQVSPLIACHIIHNGSGTMIYNGKKYKVGSGKLFIFWPDAHIKYYDTPDSPWQYTWFFLVGTKAEWMLSRIGITPDNPIYDITGCQSFLSCLKIITERFKSENYPSIFPITAAWELFNALGNDLNIHHSTKPDNLAEASRLFIESQSHLTVIPTVDDIAEHFGVNRSTLYRVFKNQFDYSPKEFIENLRFNKACKLLERTSLNIKDVAKSCGYSHQCYFTSMFQKRFGMSPTKWKTSESTTTVS